MRHSVSSRRSSASEDGACLENLRRGHSPGGVKPAFDLQAIPSGCAISGVETLSGQLMLGNLAVRATAAVLGLGSMAAPCGTVGPARGLLQRAAAARPAFPPCARSLFGAGWARSLAGNDGQGQQGAPGGRVAAASYTYEAVAQDGAAAEIAEVDFDASLANTGEALGAAGRPPMGSIACVTGATHFAAPLAPLPARSAPDRHGGRQEGAQGV